MDTFINKQVRFMFGDFYGVAEVDPPPPSKLLATKNGITHAVPHKLFVSEAEKRLWPYANIVSSDLDEHCNNNMFLISHSRLHGHRGNPLFPHHGHIIIGVNRLVLDTTTFNDKKNIIFWRGATTGYNGMENINDNLRYKFVSELFNVPNIDIGFSGFGQDVFNKWSNEYLKYSKPVVSIADQMANKFILCLEGNDVASNMGWVLSSNSCPIIAYPFEFECYIHGQGLIPWEHFIPVKRDFTDFFEIMEWCINSENHAKCEEIAKAGKLYMEPYNDKELYRKIVDTFFYMLPLIRVEI